MKKLLHFTAVVLLIAGCEEPPKVEPIQPRKVITHTIQKPTSVIERNFSGVTQASDSVDFGFEVSGRIQSISAVKGRHYKKDEILAKLDPTSYQTEFNRATADALKASEELKRVQQLFENQNASRSQFDSAVAAQQNAQANLKKAQKSLTDCVLKMPYTGFIAEVLKDSQQVVNPGEPVFRVRGEGTTELEIGIPANIIESIKVGDETQVKLSAKPNTIFEGKITEIATQSSEDTTYAVTIALDSKGVQLREGLDGEATLTLPHPGGSVIVVPAVSVIGSPSGDQSIWLVEPIPESNPPLARVKSLVVKTGALRKNGYIEVLEGASPGQVIISRGVHRVEDGMNVKIESK